MPFGAGVGLTFDEAALLLDLRDVYWTREGLLSVQLSLGGLVLLGGTILALRMLRRGELASEEAGEIPDAAGAMIAGSAMGLTGALDRLTRRGPRCRWLRRRAARSAAHCPARVELVAVAQQPAQLEVDRACPAGPRSSAGRRRRPASGRS